LFFAVIEIRSVFSVLFRDYWKNQIHTAKPAPAGSGRGREGRQVFNGFLCALCAFAVRKWFFHSGGLIILPYPPEPELLVLRRH
jgi:hypothetical protein